MKSDGNCLHRPVPVAFSFFSHVAAAFSPRLPGVLNGTRFIWGVKEKEKKRGNGEGEEMTECGRKVVTLL